MKKLIKVIIGAWLITGTAYAGNETDGSFNEKVDKVNETNKSGSWQITKYMSPIGAGTTVYLHIDALNGISTEFNKSTSPKMIIRCTGNKIQLYIDWGIFFQSQEVQLLTKVDNEKAVKTPWRIVDSETTHHPTDTNKFIESLLGKEKLFIQVSTDDKSSVNATFEISGLDEAIKPLREFCNG